MTRIEVGAHNPYQSVPDTPAVLEHVYKLMSAIDPNTANTINPKNDEAIQYPYSIYDVSFDQAPDDQRSEGVYLDVELYDRATSYAALWALENNMRRALDKSRFLSKDYYFMIKWNRSNQIGTEQSGLLRIACQFYIKAESRKKRS